MSKEHVLRVRILYKAILRLHRGLPLELKALGDQYVKEEFKRHKTCEKDFIPSFMNEWTAYVVTLAQQVGKRSVNQNFGLNLNEKQLQQLSGEQVGQLYELFKEAQKPIDEENPLGHNPHVNNK